MNDKKGSFRIIVNESIVPEGHPDLLIRFPSSPTHRHRHPRKKKNYIIATKLQSNLMHSHLIGLICTFSSIHHPGIRRGFRLQNLAGRHGVQEKDTSPKVVATIVAETKKHGSSAYVSRAQQR